MTQICIDSNYPVQLVSALKLIHEINHPANEIKIIEDQPLTESDSSSTVVFRFDTGKRSLDLRTEWYFEKGFRVFAFKLASTKTLNPFELSITVLSFWKKILAIIEESKTPFIVTYTYKGKSLNKLK